MLAFEVLCTHDTQTITLVAFPPVDWLAFGCLAFWTIQQATLDQSCRHAA